MFNEEKSEFIYVEEQTIQLEHSLLSISKWESKWGKPFLDKANKTEEELMDYIRCMTLTQNVNPSSYFALGKENIDKIKKYIDAPMTATTFSNNKQSKPNREIITAELIYYWMIAYNIPFECQKWHLNRLLTLIRVCAIKNEKPKKMSKHDVLSRNRALNEARKLQYNTSG